MKRVLVEIEGTIHSFYDPNIESLEDAKIRITFETEQTINIAQVINKVYPLRIHLKEGVKDGSSESS